MIQKKSYCVYKFNVKQKTEVQMYWKCGVCMQKVMSNFSRKINIRGMREIYKKVVKERNKIEEWKNEIFFDKIFIK